MKDFPLITAHTGCMGTPYNTLLSVQAGLAEGADIVEDDIRVTQDGVLVLAHDDAVTFADGSEASISGVTFAQLNDMLTVPLTALEPALVMIRDAGRMMNLDLKTDSCIVLVSELVERLGCLDHVFLSGCPAARARKAMLHNPRLNKLLNVDVGLFASLNYNAAVHQSCEDARSAGCFGLNLPYQLMRSELLETTSDYNLPVYIWTVDEEEQMRRFASMGVRSITTRDVAALARVKREDAGYGL